MSATAFQRLRREAADRELQEAELTVETAEGAQTAEVGDEDTQTTEEPTAETQEAEETAEEQVAEDNPARGGRRARG